MATWRVLVLLAAVAMRNDGYRPAKRWGHTFRADVSWNALDVDRTARDRGILHFEARDGASVLEGLDTTAAIVVVRGPVLFQYGDCERVSYIASVRKSVLAMLFGEYVARGEIRETATLGTVFEHETRQDIYDALDHDLARPIAMEDFRRADQRKASDDAISIHPAYHMYLSTRDMARLGYLMLRRGSWQDRELIPPGWVAEITTATSHAEDMHGYETWGLGYGKLWWLFDDPDSRAGGPLQGAYSAIGAFGQYITVIPKLDMVIAHKVVHVAREDVDVPTYRDLVRRIVACRQTIP